MDHLFGEPVPKKKKKDETPVLEEDEAPLIISDKSPTPVKAMKAMKTAMKTAKKTAKKAMEVIVTPKGIKMKKNMIDCNLDFQHCSLKGPFAKQSYILQKGSLVVACNASQSDDFHQVLVKVMNKIKAADQNSEILTKSWAVQFRNSLIGRD